MRRMLVSVQVFVGSPVGLAAVVVDAAAALLMCAVDRQVMVWLIGEPNGLYRGRIADTPASPVAGYGRNLAQPVMLGFDLYRDLLAERGNLIPLANGHNVTVNIVYIKSDNQTDRTANKLAHTDLNGQQLQNGSSTHTQFSCFVLLV